MPFTSGLRSRSGVVASVDAPPLTLLKKAGAIPLVTTNTSELCMWLESHNHLHGITNNPYDLERIPGGSSGEPHLGCVWSRSPPNKMLRASFSPRCPLSTSGGEGSLLGAAGSVIGVGSDIGGSIRIPAFFNGIFGHKTTSGKTNGRPHLGLLRTFVLVFVC